MKILHIIDNSKFHSYLASTFEIDGFENSYFSSEQLTDLDNERTKNYDHVIIHYLNNEKARWLLKINHNSVIWFIWGGDIYSLAKFRNNIYLPQTKALLKSLKPLYKRYGFLKIIYFRMFPRVFDFLYNRYKIKAFKKITVSVPVLKHDYELLVEKYHIGFPSFNVNYLIPNIDTVKNENITGINILFGNSSHPSNNHLEILPYLIMGGIERNREIITPLNYGNFRYRDVLIKELNKVDYLKFNFLLELLPMVDYLDLVKTCNVMIFNNIRQQGLGTIIHGLIFGAHIFMNSNSPQYEFLIKNGFIVSKLNSKSTFEGLTNEEQAVNRMKIDEIYGEESNKIKIRQLLNK